MGVIDIIQKKRDGCELSEEEIRFIVLGFTHGDIPDYQMSAWLMAVVCRGMSERETADLTMAMAHSGDVLDLSSVAPMVADKHSTGGVGDKTTLAVAPLVACLGVPVGKMSGRSLGFTGGTLDKLESIPGFRVGLTREEFIDVLRRCGVVVAAQTADLAPADGKIYALRDVTGTVASMPLIASSIMSKKIASGSNAIVLDVKTGAGAFMKTEAEARRLAETMVSLGRAVGRRMSAVISGMEQPLGFAVGNAVEVAEAIATLEGHGPPDFVEHVLQVSAEMLLLAGRYSVPESAREQLSGAIESGRAIDKFREWIRAQGGDDGVVDAPDRMPQARLRRELVSPQTGYIAAIDAMSVGSAATALGAGRQKKGEAVDAAVGVVLQKKVGDMVRKGEPLLTVHANNEKHLEQVLPRLAAAYRWSEGPVEPEPLIRGIIH